jgi:hypothetical protein
LQENRLSRAVRCTSATERSARVSASVSASVPPSHSLYVQADVMYPLHYALEWGAPVSSVRRLLRAYPAAASSCKGEHAPVNRAGGPSLLPVCLPACLSVRLSETWKRARVYVKSTQRSACSLEGCSRDLSAKRNSRPSCLSICSSHNQERQRDGGVEAVRQERQRDGERHTQESQRDAETEAARQERREDRAMLMENAATTLQSRSRRRSVRF